MKQHLKKYNNYKDSGIEWLGEIPEHWILGRVKDLVKIKGGQDQKKVLNHNGKYPVYGSGGIFGRADKYLYNKTSVLLGRKGTIDKPLYVDIPFWTVDTMYYTEIFKNTNPRFFYYRCTCISFDLYQYGSAIPSMTQGDLININFAIPPLKEQTQIANYLDAKTTALDKKINLLKQKIKHYKAYRKSLINSAVTKGLDKSIKLKDSGINWIGEIPAHWEIKRVKDIFSISRGRAIGKTELMSNGKYPVYSSQTKNKGVLGYINTYDFNANLLTWTTDGVNAGTVFIREGKFNCTNICGTLIPKKHPKLSLDYMAFAVQESTQHNKRIDTNGAKIMSNEMAVIDIVFPPIEEQIKIANHIKSKTEIISKVVNNIETQINTLKELRKTLINEVVTGKVKVTA
ncbi:restriction endonuclease subunit S [Tenacibaculum sp. A30]|uniref:restriction endonuclease subunit S n=1 Tax=Tenacibaculum sp. A30 TaxID=3442644 RepID=UPI003EB8C0EA